MRIFYFHIPKTGGSSVNAFFSKKMHRYLVHIEGLKKIEKTFLEKYQFVSGHVRFSTMEKILNLNEWITIATFRDPLSHVISHLRWVRSLVDNEERFKNHPKIFQEISLKMTEYDFSNPNEIEAFIKWLENIGFYYFHNTQTFYMCESSSEKIDDYQVEIALKNLQKIDFIGITEDLDSFFKIISYEFGWEYTEAPMENINPNTYGFDFNNPETAQVLLPLYEKDLIIYKEAQKIFKKLIEKYNVEIDYNKVIGCVDLISSHKITGWAFSEDSLKKVELTLYINEKLIKKTLPNKFAPIIKKEKKHPTGLCRFEFTLEKGITSKDKIKVKAGNKVLPVLDGAAKI